jgi:hypothetical protein
MFYGRIKFILLHQQLPPNPSPQASGTFECAKRHPNIKLAVGFKLIKENEENQV